MYNLYGHCILLKDINHVKQSTNNGSIQLNHRYHSVKGNLLVQTSKHAYMLSKHNMIFSLKISNFKYMFTNSFVKCNGAIVFTQV